MKISIYISEPVGKTTAYLRIVHRLKAMTGKDVKFDCLNTFISPYNQFDSMCDSLRHMEHCDFAIFADGWTDDPCCKVERSVAQVFDVRYCDEHQLENCLKYCIRESFNFDI